MSPAKLWRPSDPQFIADPYPHYERIREQASVFQASTGDYVVLGYEDVRQVLHDKTCLSGSRLGWVRKMVPYAQAKGMDFHLVERLTSGMLIQLNAPDHTQIRTLLMKNWPTPSAIQALTDKALVELLAELPGGRVDLVSAISKKLPLRIIAQFLGIEAAEAERLVGDGLRLVQLMDPYMNYRELVEVNQSTRNLYAFFENYEVNDNSPSLARAIYQYYQANPDEAVSLMIFLFVAGYETTATLLSICMHALLQDKSLLDKLTDDQAIERLVSELLRIHAPVQLAARITTRPLTLSGVDIAEGSTLTLCLAAANRDPAVFPNPDQIQLDRSFTGHLSFGYGIHHCLGNQMAQIEASGLIRSMLPLIAEMELEEMSPYRKLTIRSIDHLYVNRK